MLYDSGAGDAQSIILLSSERAVGNRRAVETGGRDGTEKRPGRNIYDGSIADN
jgi:hypothetical protein